MKMFLAMLFLVSSVAMAAETPSATTMGEKPTDTKCTDIVAGGSTVTPPPTAPADASKPSTGTSAAAQQQ